jgi:hypothetical protein
MIYNYRASSHIVSGQSPRKLMFGPETHTRLLAACTRGGCSSKLDHVRRKYDVYQERLNIMT